MTAPTRAPARRTAPATAPARSRTPDLRVVPRDARSPRAQQRRARLVAMAATVLVSVLLFGVVAFHAVLSQGQLQLDRLQTEAETQQAKYDRLRLQVAELEAPERVVAVAQQRLGMVPPPGVTYLSPSGATKSGPRSRHADRSATPDASWPTVKAHLAGR